MSVWLKTKMFLGFVEEEAPSGTARVETVAKPVMSAFSVARRFPSSEIHVVVPRVYEDSLSISTHLREGKPVITNLKYLDKQTGKRLIDFVSGTAYAVDGHMIKLGDGIFLLTPAMVHIVDSESTQELISSEGVSSAGVDGFLKKTKR